MQKYGTQLLNVLHVVVPKRRQSRNFGDDINMSQLSIMVLSQVQSKHTQIQRFHWSSMLKLRLESILSKDVGIMQLVCMSPTCDCQSHHCSKFLSSCLVMAWLSHHVTIHKIGCQSVIMVYPLGKPFINVTEDCLSYITIHPSAVMGSKGNHHHQTLCVWQNT